MAKQARRLGRRLPGTRAPPAAPAPGRWWMMTSRSLASGQATSATLRAQRKRSIWVIERRRCIHSSREGGAEGSRLWGMDLDGLGVYGTLYIGCMIG
eukprot:4705372-Prymnesium_polylepis.1